MLTDIAVSDIAVRTDARVKMLGLGTQEWETVKLAVGYEITKTN